jgi:hypothetical protein
MKGPQAPLGPIGAAVQGLLDPKIVHETKLGLAEFLDWRIDD